MHIHPRPVQLKNRIVWVRIQCVSEPLTGSLEFRYFASALKHAVTASSKSLILPAIVLIVFKNLVRSLVAA